MASVAVAMRLPEALAARIDTFRKAVMTEHPGLNVTRTQAVVMLATEALDARKIAAPEVTSQRSPAAKKGAKRAARKP